MYLLGYGLYYIAMHLNRHIKSIIKYISSVNVVCVPMNCQINENRHK